MMLVCVVGAAALRILPGTMPRASQSLAPLRGGAAKCVEITSGVEFDTIAREWRMKWSADDDKKSLASAQEALNELLPTVKAVKGVVCGGCLDFKVITALEADEFGAWEEAGFAPE